MASGAAKLIPSDPEKVMVIRRITPDLITCSTPFLRFGQIKIGGRGTLAKLATGSVAVFSPTALTSTVQKELESFGPVKYIIAIDQEHHIFLESWHKAYPNAKVLAPDTLPALRTKQKYFELPKSAWHLLSPTSAAVSIDPEFDSSFTTEYVHGHTNKELVFLHKSSKTLIEGDLLFNLPATEQFSKTSINPTSGVLTKIFCRLQSTQGAALGQKRTVWYGLSSADRPAFNQSMLRIRAWDFDRIVPCHGDVIETGGKGIFEKIMEWHLKAAEKK